MTVVSSDPRYDFPPPYLPPSGARGKLCSPAQSNHNQQDTYQYIVPMLSYVLPPLWQLHQRSFLVCSF